MMMATAGVSRWDARDRTADTDPTEEEGTQGRYIAEPERRLMFAILTDAIVRFRRLTESRRPRARYDLMEAAHWLRSEDRVWPCSFVNVCEALDIAPEPLRRAVLKWQTVPARRRVTRRAMLVGKLAAVEPSESR